MSARARAERGRTCRCIDAQSRRRSGATPASRHDLQFFREILLMKFPGEHRRRGARGAYALRDEISAMHRADHGQRASRTRRFTFTTGSPRSTKSAASRAFRCDASRRFIGKTRRAAEHFPHAMLATSTHDTKRSEDVRARLAASPKFPQNGGAPHALAHHKSKAQASESTANARPTRTRNICFTRRCSARGRSSRGSRAEAYVQAHSGLHGKGDARGKVNSSWIEPNEAWDKAVRDFIAKILAALAAQSFPCELFAARERIAQLGVVNSLAQTVLKLTAPGVPDIYQGREIGIFPGRSRQSAAGRLRLATQPTRINQKWRVARGAA